jgi:hypothetical protein
MNEDHPSPFPRALILDTSFLRTIGGTDSDAYNSFITYARDQNCDLYLTNGVAKELTEQRGYISIDWLDRANTTEWITLIDDVQSGVRVHDGPVRGKSWTKFTNG